MLIVESEIYKFIENIGNYPCKDLYHYTNFSGLKGILSTRKLWMNHYEKLNDSNEIKYAHKTALEYLCNHKKQSHYPDFWHVFLEKFKNVLEIGNYYVCSFSHDPNNELLWNEYATKDGFAIKFHKAYFTPNHIRNDLRREHKVKPQLLLTAQNIHYGNDNFLQHTQKAIEIIEKNLSQNEQHNIGLGSLLITVLLTIFPTIKNDNYYKENESRLYRFIPSVSISSMLPNKSKIRRSTENTIGNKIIVHQKFKQKNISQIIMNSSSGIKKNEIEKLLYRYQFSHIDILQR